MTMVSSGEISIGGSATSGGLNRSINVELGLSPTASTSLNQANVRTLAGVPSGTISLSNFYGKSNYLPTQRGIMAFGSNFISPGVHSYANLISSSTGGTSSDTATVGTARFSIAACTFGGDKGIFGYGPTTDTYPTWNYSSNTNIVSNVGVVASNVSSSGTVRQGYMAATYGLDKGGFYFGSTTNDSSTAGIVNIFNLISNTGVIASNTTAVGTKRFRGAGLGYGTDKGIIAFGWNGTTNLAMSNLISNTGVLATDTAAVGTPRRNLAACTYGGDKGLFALGYSTGYSSAVNLVSNTGVVAASILGSGGRNTVSGTGYGGDKGVILFGYDGAYRSYLNLVTNTGSFGATTSGTGSARGSYGACGYSTTP